MLEVHPAIGSNPTPPRALPRVSVIFSFFNEEHVLPELIARVRKVLQRERLEHSIDSHELIFVNDASTDDSETVLRAHAAAHDDIRVLTTSRQFGVSPCVLAGMRVATGDLLIYMDADLQDPPEVIPKLLVAWRSEPDVEVVHTVRVRREGETRIKLLITSLGYHILRQVSTVDLPIEAGDFKLVTRRIRDHLVAFREKRPYLRGLVCWVGFKSKKVEYNREQRAGGATKFPLGARVLRNFIDSALIAFSDVPLKLSILAGAIVTAAALLDLCWLFWAYLTSAALPAWSGVLAAVLLLGGINLLGMGMLGLYVSSIFLEVKGRPNYIIRSTFGFPDEHGPGHSGCTVSPASSKGSPGQ